MYLRIRVAPADYSYMDSIARYEMFEVDDDFNEWPEEDRTALMLELEQEAAMSYLEIDTEVCEGNFEDDPDY